MTDTTNTPGDDHEETERRMRAVAAELTAAGLDARVYDTHGVLDIAAILYRPGSKDTDVTVDEDGYVELRYWSPPGATPAQITATISRLLAVITELP